MKLLILYEAVVIEVEAGKERGKLLPFRFVPEIQKGVTELFFVDAIVAILVKETK